MKKALLIYLLTSALISCQNYDVRTELIGEPLPEKKADYQKRIIGQLSGKYALADQRLLSSRWSKAESLMKEQQRHIFTQLKENRGYGTVLGLSLLFFLYKGILYALMGSYVPILFIGAIILLFMLGFNSSEKVFKRVLLMWSLLLILWAFVRLLLGGVNQFLKPIPEGHIDGQLGIMGALLSLSILAGGVYLWRGKRSVGEGRVARK